MLPDTAKLFPDITISALRIFRCIARHNISDIFLESDCRILRLVIALVSLEDVSKQALKLLSACARFQSLVGPLIRCSAHDELFKVFYRFKRTSSEMSEVLRYAVVSFNIQEAQLACTCLQDLVSASDRGTPFISSDNIDFVKTLKTLVCKELSDCSLESSDDLTLLMSSSKQLLTSVADRFRSGASAPVAAHCQDVMRSVSQPASQLSDT